MWCCWICPDGNAGSTSAAAGRIGSTTLKTRTNRGYGLLVWDNREAP